MRTYTYQKKKKKTQLEYIQSQINEIRNLVDYRQSQLAWQTVNEKSGKKSILRAKLKPDSQEERLQKLKEHFKNLLRNPPEVTDKPIKTIIINQ